ncbi:MAG: CidA/LrgA family protein [Bacteroidetes bacterium]|nr:MAG: CidA/LrgA family protein [Bacteroidota bacterium]
MVRQCFVLFSCLAFGELVVWATGISLPSSIIGMLTLTLALRFGVVKLHWIEGLSNFLVQNLAFFFVPAGVGLMKHYGLLVGELLPITVATVLSTILVLFVTGRVHQWLEKHDVFHK